MLLGSERFTFRNYARFYGEELSAPRPNPRVQDHPLSVVRDCLFKIFTATLHIAGRSSISSLRKRHAVLTGTDLAHNREVLVVVRKEIGQEVNVDKTKYIVMFRVQNAGGSHNRKIDNSSFERVEEFKYL